MDGMFGFVTWSMWTFNGIESDWNFLIGMNQLNETNSVQGFNISREDGSLKIDKVHPCDVTSFMCKAEREMVNGTSRPPKKHYVTLRVINQKCNRTSTTSTPETGQNPQGCEKGPVKTTSYSGADRIAAIIACLLAAAKLVVILYLKRRKLREIFDRCTGRTESPTPT